MRLVSSPRNNLFATFITETRELIYVNYFIIIIYRCGSTLSNILWYPSMWFLKSSAKLANLGWKTITKIPHANHGTCRDCMFYNTGSLVELQKYFKSEDRPCAFVCTYHVLFSISATKVKLDVVTHMITSYGKEKRLNTKFFHRLTRTGSRSISNQALSESQSWAGFSISLGTVEPPAKRKRHSS